MITGDDTLPIPLVVQLGFAGSRNLFDATDVPNAIGPDEFEGKVCQELTEFIRHLPSVLGLSPRHFLCCISQIAIGGDTVFTRACQSLGIPQRIFLPQHFDEYLNASGGKVPDFSPTQKHAARDLLASPHVIQEQVVSDASERRVRFSEANWEILRASDLILCLVREDQMPNPGGTLEMIEMARRCGKPTLLLTLVYEKGNPVLKSEWFNRDRFQAPALPRQLRKISPLPPTASKGEAQGIHDLPTARVYADHLKQQASFLARSHKGLFRTAALIIITTHILATMCAVIAVQFHAWLAHAMCWFLVPELLLLALGFTIHHRLHRRESNHLWAASRLIAELGRSVVAIGKQQLHLEYLFQLPFPASFQPLLRTLNILHLSSNARTSADDWQVHRDAYIQHRLEGKNGQIDFYARESARAAKLLHKAHIAFNVCSLGAFAATLCKLTHVFGEGLGPILGPLAILLPVLAVASLSLAAAFDLEARQHTFADMLVFLQSQLKQLNDASNGRELGQLVMETESRLLGETLNWYSRRTFTGIA